MLIHKWKTDDKLEYIKYDEETDHHIIDRIRWRIVYEKEERDYIESDNELIAWLLTVMDDDTELYIVPVNEVKWSPYDYGYFYY